MPTEAIGYESGYRSSDPVWVMKIQTSGFFHGTVRTAPALKFHLLNPRTQRI